MKNEQSMVSTEPLGLTPEQCCEIIPSPVLFKKLVSARWLKPVVDRHKATLYDYGDLKLCWARLRRGEYPEVKQ